MNTKTDAAAGEFDLSYAAEQLRRSQSPWRRLIKGFYLRSMLRQLSGPTVDFGCGAGQLLARLPSGSVGIEVNPHLIESLRGAGHQVFAARAEISDFELRDLPPGRFQSLVIAHVLEHLPDPALAIDVLLSACRRIGIRRVLVVVSGCLGFRPRSTASCAPRPATFRAPGAGSGATSSSTRPRWSSSWAASRADPRGAGADGLVSALRAGRPTGAGLARRRSAPVHWGLNNQTLELLTSALRRP
jgi:SAM-dependent methyltransferase